MTWEIDTTGFKNLVTGLSHMSGAPEQAVVLERAGHVLANAARYTPTRSAGQIETSVKFRNRNLWEGSQLPTLRGDPIISITKSQVAWYIEDSSYDGHGPAPAGRRVGGKTFHIMNDQFRWSDARWSRFQNALQELQSKQMDLAAAKRSRGIMAKSWYQIGQSLGIEIDVPDYVKTAQPMNGQTYQDGTANKATTADGFFVDLINSNPILINRLRGAEILSRAVQATINQFAIDMEKGVFQDIKTRAQRYPGIFVS